MLGTSEDNLIHLPEGVRKSFQKLIHSLKVLGEQDAKEKALAKQVREQAQAKLEAQVLQKEAQAKADATAQAARVAEAEAK